VTKQYKVYIPIRVPLLPSLHPLTSTIFLRTIANVKRVLAGWFFVTFALPLFPEVPGAARELEQGYQTALRALDTERDEQVGNVSQGYVGAIDRQIETYQQAGDLDGILAAKAEKSRFEEKVLPPSVEEHSTYPEVRELQARLTTAFSTITQQHAEKTAALLTRYVDTLDGLVTQLTTQGNIEEAIAVRDYRNKLAETLQAPQQDLAEHRQEPPQQTGIPAKGEFMFQGKRYRIIEEQVSWSEARKAARAAGGDLVVLKSKAQHDALMEALDGRRSWLGAVIPTDGKPNVWIDGTPLEPIKGVRYRNNGKKDENQYMTLTPENMLDDYHDVKTNRIPAYIIQF